MNIQEAIKPDSTLKYEPTLVGDSKDTDGVGVGVGDAAKEDCPKIEIEAVNPIARSFFIIGPILIYLNFTARMD